MSQLTRGQVRRLMYIERKTDHSDDGPARIGWVTFSQSERTIYYDGKAYQRLKGGGVAGNYFETESGDEYWISGVKKSGSNRHIWGHGPIEVDDDAIDEYRRVRETDA